MYFCVKYESMFLACELKDRKLFLACCWLFTGSDVHLDLLLQGRILDHVIQRAVGLFKRDVVLLIVFSLVTGLFEAVRNLCFAVVGKRVLKTLQDKLFTGIIIQDIAYFDGTTSGEVCMLLHN